jgi:hypothetical protein
MHVRVIRSSQCDRSIYTRYVRVFVSGHYEVLPLEGRNAGFRAWLIRRYHAQEGRTPSGTAVGDALDVLKAEAQFSGLIREAYTRPASHAGKLYLNLSNDTWDVVEVDAEGWRIVHDPPVCFIRVKGMLPLPRPEAGGTLRDLLQLFNIPEGSDLAKLILGWLIGSLMPGGAYAHLCIHGQQGSVKSTLTKMLRLIVDPNEALSRSLPKEERDLVIAARNAHIVAFENVSRLPDWLSDALCCLSTGTGLSTRRLYTDDDEVIFSVKRPVILNGIAAVAVRGDLIDRCIVISLPPIPEELRRTEAEVWEAFQAAHPGMLGALLTAASTALRRLPEANPD